MIEHLEFEVFITHERQGEYITHPFQMPENVETFTMTYHYPRFGQSTEKVNGGLFTAQRQTNIIDLGLINPDGHQAGASGSDKHEVTMSATTATPGYTPQPLTPGQWHILIGAYHVAEEGVNVKYELTFTPKQKVLLVGDIHTHTLASDGVLSTEELAAHARRHGLDFLAITDHNQMVSTEKLNAIKGITLIPGVEWTHYQGHANFLGIDQPYDEPYFTRTDDEMRARFRSAHQRGALIVINHPRDDPYGFNFDLDTLPFDCLEVWNGPMRESNLRAIGLWQSMLESGKKVPAVGGSDYHRDGLFQILGGPCMGVYAMGNTPQDILAALRAGHSFIRFAPQGPSIILQAGESFMGDTTVWQDGQTVAINASGLEKGDLIRVIANAETTELFQAPEKGAVDLTFSVAEPGFMRVEILRTFLPTLPPLPALISNPIYFSAPDKSV